MAKLRPITKTRTPDYSLGGGQVKFFHGDALSVLADLPTGSVTSYITSPPVNSDFEESVAAARSRHGDTDLLLYFDPLLGAGPTPLQAPVRSG